MIESLGEAFVLLANGPTPAADQYATRIVSDSEAEIRAGIDKNGFRHLLIAVDEEVSPDTTSAALTLRSSAREVDGTVQTFADLRCSDARLALVFERLASDVTSRIEGGVEPATALPVALREWRDLFKSGAQGITVEQVVGLIGELQVLARLAQSVGHDAALDAWWGPDGHPHDFYAADGSAIEVKATRALEGNRIHVSNLEQLDPDGVTSLHLAVHHLRPSRDAPTLNDRISQLLQDGFPSARLLTKVQDAGYTYEAQTGVNTRFKVVSDAWWRVDDAFPGVRTSRLSQAALKGVSDIKYVLSLDAVGRSLSEEDTAVLFDQWEA